MAPLENGWQADPLLNRVCAIGPRGVLYPVAPAAIIARLEYLEAEAAKPALDDADLVAILKRNAWAEARIREGAGLDKGAPKSGTFFIAAAGRLLEALADTRLLAETLAELSAWAREQAGGKA